MADVVFPKIEMVWGKRVSQKLMCQLCERALSELWDSSGEGEVPGGRLLVLVLMVVFPQLMTGKDEFQSGIVLLSYGRVCLS